MIYALYPIALNRGISQSEFWESSVPDLLDRLKAIDEEETRKLKEKVSLIFTQSEAVASRLGYLFADTKKRKRSDILQPWNVYPDLFETEKEIIENAESEANLEQQKKAMEYYSKKRLNNG